MCLRSAPLQQEQAFNCRGLSGALFPVALCTFCPQPWKAEPQPGAQTKRHRSARPASQSCRLPDPWWVSYCAQKHTLFQSGSCSNISEEGFSAITREGEMFSTSFPKLITQNPTLLGEENGSPFGRKSCHKEFMPPLRPSSSSFLISDLKKHEPRGSRRRGAYLRQSSAQQRGKEEPPHVPHEPPRHWEGGGGEAPHKGPLCLRGRTHASTSHARLCAHTLRLCFRSQGPALINTLFSFLRLASC